MPGFEDLGFGILALSFRVDSISCGLCSATGSFLVLPRAMYENSVLPDSLGLKWRNSLFRLHLQVRVCGPWFGGSPGADPCWGLRMLSFKLPRTVKPHSQCGG